MHRKRRISMICFAAVVLLLSLATDVARAFITITSMLVILSMSLLIVGQVLQLRKAVKPPVI
jgi:hypothetical protein